MILFFMIVTNMYSKILWHDKIQILAWVDKMIRFKYCMCIFCEMLISTIIIDYT